MTTRLRLADIANLLVIGLVCFVLLRPNGLLGSYVGARYKEYQARRVIANEWNDVVRGPRLDANGKAILLVEFSDYECPACRQQSARLEAAISSYPELGGITYRHFPLSNHVHAEGAARAAICAEKEGRFLALHRQLFTTEKWIADTNWAREAKAVGIDGTTAFKICMSSVETTSRLTVDRAMARRLGIGATPSFVSRTGVHAGGLLDTSLVRFARGEK